MIYNEISGDITKITPDHNVVIPHICNDIGKWGKGFVLSLSKRWPKTRSEYLSFVDHNGLGTCQFVQVEDNITVANMIAQHGIGRTPDRPPIRYGALTTAMNNVARYCHDTDATIACPKFGSGLAGGQWSIIRQLVYELWVDNGIDVTVYEY